MPTKNEQRALIFVAGVIVLGASVRVVRAARTSPSAADSSALAHQRIAADSARNADRTKHGKSRGRTPHHPRVHVTRDTAPKSPSKPARERLDVDRATAAQIESLPGVGAVLAKRIVAERDSRGPFGSLVALQDVRGIGPALAKRLDSLVTFSGPPRPPSATPIDASTRSAFPRARGEPRSFLSPAYRDSVVRRARRNRTARDSTSLPLAPRPPTSPVVVPRLTS